MPASPTVRRIYQGTPGNSVVTEIISTSHSPKRSPEKNFRKSSSQEPQSLEPRARRSPVSPYVRSPSPQRRYHIDDPEVVHHRVTDPLDKSYHQSQKRLQESHLEERNSSLTYELETLKQQMSKIQKRADAAIAKSERVERDHTALSAERDAALAQAAACEEEYRQHKETCDAHALEACHKEVEAKVEEIHSLRSQLAEVIQQRDDAYAKLNEIQPHETIKKAVQVKAVSKKAPAKVAAKVEVKIIEITEADLMQVFDTLDEDETGFAPRLDLRMAVDQFIPSNPRVQELSDTIRGLDVMILERDDYVEIVMEWLNGSQKKEHKEKHHKKEEPSEHDKKKLRESIKEKLMDAFDEVDEDGTEFAPRLDLRKQVDKHVGEVPDAQSLSDYIRAQDVMIVEKDDYVEWVHAWVKGELQ